MTHCPLLQRLHLRSLAARRGRESPNAQSVLYSVINLHGRLPTSSFTRNLLLPNSIGLSPYTQLVRAICRSATVRSSTQLSSGFNLAGIDRRASGPPPLTPSEHTSSLTVNCCGLVGFLGYGDQLLNLANDQDSWGIFRNARIDAAHIFAFTPIQPVPIWFHVLFTSR